MFSPPGNWACRKALPPAVRKRRTPSLCGPGRPLPSPPPGLQGQRPPPRCAACASPEPASNRPRRARTGAGCCRRESGGARRSSASRCCRTRSSEYPTGGLRRLFHPGRIGDQRPSKRNHLRLAGRQDAFRFGRVGNQAQRHERHVRSVGGDFCVSVHVRRARIAHVGNVRFQRVGVRAIAIDQIVKAAICRKARGNPCGFGVIDAPGIRRRRGASLPI